MTSLDGKVVLVTGAASGVGLATGKLLAGSGARVVLCDLDNSGESVAAEIVASSGEAIFRRVDVRSSEQVRSAVEAAESSFGRLDGVVANAGTVGGAAVARRFEDLAEEQWSSIIDVNLLGTMRTFAAAIPALRRAGGGAMTATASIAALTGVAGQAAYSASKGGIVSVVRTLAFELVADGIRVNCVCPGGVNTNLLTSTDLLPLLAARMESVPAGGSPEPSALMNRAGDPSEVAAVHRFLLSDEASLINGQSVVCDAGSMIANLWMVVDR